MSSSPLKQQPLPKSTPDEQLLTSYEVIIIGAGPIGMCMANFLGQRGHTVLVIEKSDGGKTNPRAISMDPGTVRMLQRIGLADEMQVNLYQMLGGVLISGSCYNEPGTEVHIVNGRARDVKGKPGNWEGLDTQVPMNKNVGRFAGSFYQPELERLLRTGMERFSTNVHVKYQTFITNVMQEQTVVTVNARPSKFRWKKTVGNEYIYEDLGAGDGPELTFKAKYALGCDGGASETRISINQPLKDTFGYYSLDFDEPWVVVDIEVFDEKAIGSKLPVVAQQICDPIRVSTIVPGSRITDGNNGRQYRWEFQMAHGEDPDTMSSAKRLAEPDLIGRWLDPTEYRMVRSAYYTFHSLIAPEWVDNRIILAGDSAHQTPPFLGQGLNQGFRDCSNLEWRLSAKLKDEENENNNMVDHAIFDQYVGENLPEALLWIKGADDIGEMMNTFSLADEKLGRKGLDLMDKAFKGTGYEFPFRPDLLKAQVQSFVLAQPPAKHTDHWNLTISDMNGNPNHPIRHPNGETWSDDILGNGFCILTTSSSFSSNDLSNQNLFHALKHLVDLNVVCVEDYLKPSSQTIDTFMQGQFLKQKAMLVRPDRKIISWGEPNELLEKLSQFLKTPEIPERIPLVETIDYIVKTGVVVEAGKILEAAATTGGNSKL